jgi:Zn-dependent protease
MGKRRIIPIMEELNTIQRLIIWVLPVLSAITLHEVAHGRVALRLGDTTAKTQGRLSLNPLRHVDPVGTVLVPAVLFFLSGFIFGWAKPVPVDYRRLRHPKRDMALVALAGPGANLVMAIGWALIMSLGVALAPAAPWVGMPLYYMGQAGILINIIIGVLNMLPIPPLDGSRVLVGLLPNRVGMLIARVEPFGLVILLLMLATGLLGTLLGPPVFFLQRIIFVLLGY